MNKMNYLNYFCGIYEICFKPKHQMVQDGDKKQNKMSEFSTKSTSKFYDYQTSVSTELHQKAIAKTLSSTAAKFEGNDFDVIPKSGGDWLLRYSEFETNFNPWHFNTKFSHFELVPWRQTKKNIDLTSAIGWEPFRLTKDNFQQLRTLKKFENARTKRVLKQRSKSQRKRVKQQIKIRLVFSLEVRKKRKRSTQSTIESRRFLYAQQQMITYDEYDPYVKATSPENYPHCGYFSQRNKSLNSFLVRKLDAPPLLQSSSRKRHQSKNKMIPSTVSQFVDGNSCGKCRNRCVLFSLPSTIDSCCRVHVLRQKYFAHLLRYSNFLTCFFFASLKNWLWKIASVAKI